MTYCKSITRIFFCSAEFAMVTANCELITVNCQLITGELSLHHSQFPRDYSELLIDYRESLNQTSLHFVQVRFYWAGQSILLLWSRAGWWKSLNLMRESWKKPKCGTITERVFRRKIQKRSVASVGCFFALGPVIYFYSAWHIFSHIGIFHWELVS